MNPAPPRGFTTTEYQHRTAAAQARMATAGIDALLLTTEADIRYFTGFLTQFWQSPTRPWYTVVPAEGRPIAVIPRIGEECMARGWLDDIRCWDSPAAEDDGVSLLADALAAFGTVGLQRGRETHLRMPFDDLDALRAALPSARWADATAIVRETRLVKSEAEIAKLAHVCGLVSGVFAALPDHLEAGLAEVEIFRRFKILALEAGVDDVPYLVGGAGPGGYGDIISPPRERGLRAGDVLILDTGCVFDGYYSDFCRNWGIGQVDDAARRAHEVVWDATEAGLAAVRPGASAKDLHDAMQAVMAARGTLGNSVGRLGHGLGIQLTEPPSNAAFDEARLRPGMVITLEPGMSFAPGRMMVHEENLVVRDDGPELLTRRAPRELPLVAP